MVEYNLTLFSGYFVNDNISLMLKKHIKKEYLYLFFGSKLIISNLINGKILKVVSCLADKILITDDE